MVWLIKKNKHVVIKPINYNRFILFGVKLNTIFNEGVKLKIKLKRFTYLIQELNRVLICKGEEGE